MRSKMMRRKMMTICEVCGSTERSGAADFLVFHCLTFCSPECRDDYRVADEERRAKSRKATGATPRKRSAPARPDAL
jgi:hypothetical protein